MSWWEALLLGVVQGLSEFFPISSSGHLVITQELLGVSVPGIAFEVAVHLATLISVLVVYRETVIRLLRGLLGRSADAWGYLGKLLLASVPAGVVGLFFEDWFEARFDDPAFTATMLLVTGSFLWSARWARGLHRPGLLDLLPILVAALVSVFFGTLLPFVGVLGLKALLMGAAWWYSTPEWVQEPGWGAALAMGAAQAVAIFPGISRSGSTVVTGLWNRFDAVVAAEFSFLMSVVAISGAAVLKLPDVATEGFGVGPIPLLIGFLAAAVSGVLAIRFFVALLRRQNFYNFAWYCWIVGALFLLWL